jgi:UDP-3-O-[3-hydroxymyristoyl] glucosamine N-acyltransferase
VLVTREFPEIAAPTLRLANPYLAFARAIALLHPSPVYPPGIHPTAVIDSTAIIGAEAHIGA